MHTREIAEEYRLTHWAGIMRDRQESGLSIRAYCEQVGFHENSYYYWQKKLREAACEVTYAKPETEDPVRAVFAKVELPGMAAKLPVRTDSGENQISIDTGTVRLIAGGGYPVEKLAALIEVVTRTCL